MRTTADRSGHRTVIVGAVLILLLTAATTPVRGQVAQIKTFTLDVTAAVPAGDADAELVVTLTNTSANQDLGSANVTVPAPFAVVAAPDDTVTATASVLELRDLDLAPGDAVDVPVTVDVRTCTPATSDAFAAVAKQSNTFNGTGNDVTLDVEESGLTVEITGTCGLAFVAEPADAVQAAAITSDAFEPGGAPISVEVRDAADTGRATHATPTVDLTADNPDVDPDRDGPIALGGTRSATADAGLATFAPGPTLAPSAFDYVLAAGADLDGDGTADATTTSTPFDIVDDQVGCPAGQPCARAAEAERGGQRVTASFGAGAEDTSLVVSLGAADVPGFTCAGVPDDRATAQYFFVGGDGADRVGTVTLEIPDAAQPVNAYEVCWAAPYPFTTDDGGQASGQGTKPDGEAALHVGTLPDCARRGAPARPCVRDRTLRRRDATALITIEADGRDPWARS